MKKLLAYILTITLLLSIMPLGALTVTASNENSFNHNGFICTISNDTVTIRDVSNDYIRSAIIPDTINGYPVVSIGNYAFYDCGYLKEIEIPSSIKYIGENAFSLLSPIENVYINDLAAWCNIDFHSERSNPLLLTDNLYLNGELVTDLVIPDGVTSIDYLAFYGCESLTSVTIPDSVTSIGKKAFSGCESLTSLTIPDSVTSIGSRAFDGCDSLTSVTIGNSVTSIGDYAFYNCTSLTSITIGNGVTSIGFNVFYGCDSLTKFIVDEDNKCYSTVDGVLFNKSKTTLIQYPTGKADNPYIIPDSVISIGDYAFYNCTSLTSITIGNGVTSIGFNVFYGCDSLTKFIVDEDNKCYSTVDGVLFNKSKTTLIQYPTDKADNPYIIPDSVISIDAYAFYYCTSLTSVTIGNGVTSIGYWAFANCDKLTTVNYNATNCTSMGGSSCPVFENSPITTVNVGDNVISIPSYAFYDCDSLTSITIPDSVTSIGDTAFDDCNPTIVCYQNSYAETYAKENGLNYVYLISEVKITKQPTKTQYYEGDKIDLSGLEVTAYYYDGTSKIVTDYTVNEYDNSVGKKEIVITYKEFNDVFFVNFAAVELSGIEITSLPNSLSQNNEDSLDLTGLVVSTKYNNGDTEVINDYTVSGYDCTVGGIQTITVSYAGFTDSFDIEIFIKYPQGNCGENISWKIDPNTQTLTLSGSGSMPDYDLTGGDVAPWLEYINQIKNIQISNQITYIGNCAFTGCAGVKSLNISDSVEGIGEFAFKSCGGLLDVTIGSGIKYIGTDAFEDCPRLKKVYINDIANWCNVDFESNANPLVNNAILYVNGNAAIDLIIPNGVTKISDNAFNGCLSIKNVVILEGVESIGEDAFAQCTSLESVSIPSTLKNIDGGAFRLCDKIKNVYVTDLSSWLKIEFATYNSNPLCVAENFYLNGDLLRNLIIPDGTDEIAPMAFYDFQGFDYIYLPASITFVGEDAFYFCNFDTVEFAVGTEIILKDTLPYFRTTDAHIIIPEDVIFIESDLITGSSTQIFGKEGSSAENYAIDNETQFHKMPVSIEVVESPSRTTYYKDSKNANDYLFSTTGLKIKAYYYDGTSEILESGFKILSRDYPTIKEMTTGVHSIKLWFGGKTTTFDINVYAKEMKSISLTQLPLKTSYLLGENFDPQGMVVTAYYMDGTSEHIDVAQDMLSGFDSLTMGEKTVTVSFGGKTTSFNVVVEYHRPEYHVYDNACDITCNECGAVREITHTYSNDCDADCNVCGFERVPSDHVYDDTCDTTCNECGALRDITHTYTNNCDADCDVCGFDRVPSDHVYDDRYDADCNECGAVRAISWEIEVDVTGAYTIVPNDGYAAEFSAADIIVTDKSGSVVKYNDKVGGFPLVKGETYVVEFTEAAAENVVGEIEWAAEKIEGTIFADVPAGEWYNDAVTYSVGAGIITGYGGTNNFGAADKISRHDFVVILARFAGVDLSAYDDAEIPFKDVADNQYYTNAILWAAESGITSGYTSGVNAGKFGVGDEVTREQLVTFLYRYASNINGSAPKVSDDAAEKAATYPDFEAVGSYAKEPVIWALDKGVIAGQGGTHIAPGGNALRAEVAKIFYNIYLNNIF